MIRGEPTDILPKVWKDWKISKLCYELDYEPYARQRDAKIQELAKEAGLHFQHSRGLLHCFNTKAADVTSSYLAQQSLYHTALPLIVEAMQD